MPIDAPEHLRLMWGSAATDILTRNTTGTRSQSAWILQCYWCQKPGSNGKHSLWYVLPQPPATRFIRRKP